MKNREIKCFCCNHLLLIGEEKTASERQPVVSLYSHRGPVRITPEQALELGMELVQWAKQKIKERAVNSTVENVHATVNGKKKSKPQIDMGLLAITAMNIFEAFVERGDNPEVPEEANNLKKEED